MRVIHKEELWLYQNEAMPSYFSGPSLWVVIVLLPIAITLYIYKTTRCWIDVYQCMLGLTLAIPVTLCICNFLKLSVGRPRPDFYSRCFPDQRYNEAMRCTGDHADVIEGRKSFPSSHAALSFASLGYMFFYMVGKWHCCSKEGMSDTKKLLMSLSVLFVALVVGVSRIADNHHHPDDVLAGIVIGMAMAYVCYRHVFPAPYHELSHIPYCLMTTEPASVPAPTHSYLPLREDDSVVRPCGKRQSVTSLHD